VKKERPELHFQSRHESGNTLYILTMVRDVLRKQRRYTDYNNLRDAVLNAGSYEEALHLMNEHVRLIDDDGLYVLQKGI